MAENKKKDIFGKAKSAVGGIGSKVGKSLSDIKDQASSVACCRKRRKRSKKAV